MNHYINFSDKGAANGNDGSSPELFRNEAQVIVGPSVYMDGGSVYVCGKSGALALPDSPGLVFVGDGFTIEPDAGAINGDGVHAPFYLEIEAGSSYGFCGPSTGVTIKRGIIVTDRIAMVSRLECCFLKALNGALSLWISPFYKKSEIVGCTIYGNLNFTRYVEGFPSSQVTFKSCIFVNTIFGSETSKHNMVFDNCIFVNPESVSDDDVFAIYDASGGSKTVLPNCRFVKNDYYYNDFVDVSTIKNGTTKSLLRFNRSSLVEDGVNRYHGADGYDYSYDGCGLFCGDRVAPGCWWFSNTYYVDMRLQSPTGLDGKTQATAMSRHTARAMSDTPVSGMYFRESDRFVLIGDCVGETDEIVGFPTNSIKSLGYFTDNTYESNNEYFGPIVEPIGDMVHIDVVTYPGFFEAGRCAIYKRLFLNIESIDKDLRIIGCQFASCILYNETHIILNVMSLVSNAQFQDAFVGCSFITPSLVVTGGMSQSAFAMNISDCVFFGQDGGVCEITQGPYPGYVRAEFNRCTFSSGMTEIEDEFELSSSNISFYSCLFSQILSKQFDSDPSTYLKEELVAWDYDYRQNVCETIVPSPYYTDATKYDFGVAGEVRAGRGAFYFYGESPAPYDYYTDFEAVSSGIGTKTSPFNKAQFISFFDGSMSIPHYDGDTVYCKNKCMVDMQALISPWFTKTVIIDAWDPDVNGNYIIEVDNSMVADEVSIVSLGDDTSSSTRKINVDIRSAIILAPTASCSILRLAKSSRSKCSVSFRNCLVVSDVPGISMWCGGTSSVLSADVNILCSSISIGSHCEELNFVDSDEGPGSYTLAILQETVVAIHGSPLITKSDLAIATNCEFNNSEDDFDFDTSTGNEFDNTDEDGPTKLPETLTAQNYTPDNFIFSDYVINNPGDPDEWDTLLSPHGLKKSARAGIGAFYFYTRVFRDIYFDFSKIIPGAGTQENPFNTKDWVDYWSGAGTMVGGFVPQADDTVMHSGRMDSLGSGSRFVFINAGSLSIPPGIKVLPWSLTQRGVSVVGSDTAIGKDVCIVEANSITDLVVSGVVFANVGFGRFSIARIGSDGATVDIKNVLVLNDTGGIILGDELNSESNINLYGCTLSSSADIETEPGINTTVTVNYSVLSCRSIVPIGIIDDPQPVVGGTTFNKVECSFSKGDAESVITNFTDISSVFSSTPASSVQRSMTPSAFKKQFFMYDKYGFTIGDLDESYWMDNLFQTGIGGLTRRGIGAFYFFSTYPPTPINPGTVKQAQGEDSISGVRLWDYLTTFFDFLNQSDRDDIEAYWHGTNVCAKYLLKLGNMMVGALSLLGAKTDVFEDYYDMKFGPLYSVPTDADPTSDFQSSTISSVDVCAFSDTVGDISNRRNAISVKLEDYKSFRDISSGSYVVLHSQDSIDENSDIFFRILKMVSSIEDPSGQMYTNPLRSSAGAEVHENYIVIDGDIPHSFGSEFSFHITTGKLYRIDDKIVEVNTLQSYITRDETGVIFRLGVDYTFSDNMVEFLVDQIHAGNLQNGDTLYVPKAKAMDESLYEMCGNLVDTDNWKMFNYDNYSGKAAIGALFKSLQNPGNIEEYNRALNIYYGLPIAPEDCEVVGLYESCGYEVVSVDGNTVRLGKVEGEDLHNFIQDGTEFMCEGKSSQKCFTVIDRVSGDVMLEDASEIVVGDILYNRLRNKYIVKAFVAETAEAPSAIDVYCTEGAGAISHLISVVNGVSGGVSLPEVVVYGTQDFQVNYDGVYHISSAEVTESSGSVVRLWLYKAGEDADPLYNDKISVSNDNMQCGFVHIHWPTHKFLYLNLVGSNIGIMSYIDSPLDTMYDNGDTLSRYQVICRNVMAINSKSMQYWNQYDALKGSVGVEGVEHILELVGHSDSEPFGTHFPSRFAVRN